MWIPFAIVTALAFGASSSYAKALSGRAHVTVVTWAMITLSLPWTLLVLLRDGMPDVGSGFFAPAAISVALNMIAVTLQVKALSVSPLSLTVPFLAFTPVFMIATGWAVLDEVPDARGVAGILLIAIGAYSINLEKLRGGVLGPIRAIASEPGSRLMLVVALLWSVSAAFDKRAVVESSPAFYASFFSVAFGALYAPALLWGVRRKRPPGGTVPRLFLLGGIAAAMIICQFAAIQLTLASYVIALKRSGMLVSVVLGRLFFQERMLAVRLVGAALMTAGVVLLSV